MKEFDKIIGYEPVKKELSQIIDMVKNEERYETMGAKFPKGILIYGEPGLGKTMMTEALIKGCGLPCFQIRKDAGVETCLEEIKSAFEKASKESQSIVFIDDIDKFSESNERNSDSEAFAAIQSGIDSVKEKGVLVIATANNIRKLPDSLKRSGRFDRKIELTSPNDKDARKIIEFYMRNKKVDPNLDYEDVSKMINYHSCADLENILNESGIYAAYEKKDFIDINHIVKAYLRCQYATVGLEFDDDLYCDEETLRGVAIHEAGHAVVAESLKEGSVGFITLNVAGDDSTNGHTKLCESFKRRPENVVIGLAGKAAAELFYQGRCASGCMNDLTKAGNLIADGIASNGTLGISLLDLEQGSYYNNSVYEAAKMELERYMFLTKDILIKNRDFVLKLADELQKKRHLLYSDVKRIRESCDVQMTYLP